jgi:Bacterial regulatory helix-turn-helix proteins, AraC family.
MALSLGFSPQSAFSAVFKKIMNMSPRAYREKYYNKKMTDKE